MSKFAPSAPTAEIMAALAGRAAEGFEISSEELTQAVLLAATGKTLCGEEVYVLYADVLGFRQKLEMDPVQLDRQLETALLQTNFSIMSRVPGALHRMSDGTTIQDPIVGVSKLNPPSIFSDSIFVASHDASPESLRQLAHVASTMFVNFFSQELPLRGAIAKGSVWWNRNTDVRLGEGIKKAYELAESLDCIGIALDEDFTPPANSAGPVNFFVKVKDGPAVPRELCVPLQLERNSLTMAFNPALAAAFARFAERPENTSEEKLRARYRQSVSSVGAMAGRPVRA